MKQGIAFRLSALVLTAAALVFLAVSGTGYYLARQTLLRNAEEGARSLAQAVVFRMESRLAPIVRVPRGVAYELEEGRLAGEADILVRQRRVLADNDEIFAMAVAFEPPAKGEPRPAPYTFRTPLGPKATRLGGPGYRYQNMDWYQLPRELERTVWTEPYFDEGGGNILMTTCSVPFFTTDAKGRRQVAGVVTADVSLEWLKRAVASVNVLETGYACLITGAGTYVTHPSPGVAFNETIFSRAEETGDKELRRIGRSMIRGESGFTPVTSPHTGKQGFLVYAPLPTTGWSLAVFYPKDELLADVSRQALVTAGLSGGGFLLLAALVLGIARGITRPLTRLAGAARGVAGGDLDAPLPEHKGQDEVDELAEAFGHMQRSLKEHIRELTTATASRERMESELRIARDIQMGILPKLFPPFPEHDEIDLHAILEPAREVGGDFYDFFLCGRDHFCFLVGDVSGKGVPAAFYMAVAKTLIKSLAESSAREEGLLPDPGAILARANDDLARDNDSCMFVTIFIAMIELSTGKLRYASAGHNPPALLRAGRAAELLPSAQDPVAGAMPGVEYATGSLALAPGDALLLYTDGVTEAMNAGLELFGEARLLSLASQSCGEAKTCNQALAKAIHAFAGGAEQSDDITLLTLRYLGPGPRKG